jgi:hypothetical protein
MPVAQHRAYRNEKPAATSLQVFRLSSITALLLFWLVGAVAGSLDDVSQPPPGDPSAYSDPPANPVAAAAASSAESMPEANEGSLELTNGVYGDRSTVTTDNVLQPAQTSRKYPPTASPARCSAPSRSPSNCCCSKNSARKNSTRHPALPTDLPAAHPRPGPRPGPHIVARSSPNGNALEAFLNQPGLTPFPSQYANVLDRNPWKAQIEMFLNRNSVGSPAEGRPPGKGWSHQRWNEFYPQAAFKTAQAGARINQGLRDRKQLHGYSKGEFAPAACTTRPRTSPPPWAPPRASTPASTRRCRCRTTSRCGPSTAPSRPSC